MLFSSLRNNNPRRLFLRISRCLRNSGGGQRVIGTAIKQLISLFLPVSFCFTFVHPLRINLPTYLIMAHNIVFLHNSPTHSLSGPSAGRAAGLLFKIPISQTFCRLHVIKTIYIHIPFAWQLERAHPTRHIEPAAAAAAAAWGVCHQPNLSVMRSTRMTNNLPSASNTFRFLCLWNT